MQFSPFERAANRLGAAFCVVDGFKVDVHRLISCVTLFRPKGLFGLVDELIEGVAERGTSPAALFRDIPLIAARPAARRMLAAEGVEALLWLHAGPATAVECAPGRGAHIEAAWSPAVVGGTLQLRTSSDQRFTTPTIDTGVVVGLETSPGLPASGAAFAPGARGKVRTPDLDFYQTEAWSPAGGACGITNRPGVSRRGSSARFRRGG